MAAEQVRLLLCNSCKTTEELPDYQGDPRQDDLLRILTDRHKYPDGNKHFGQLLRVDKKHWDNKSTRRAIENQIRESAGHTGLDTEFYDTKNTFQEDAMTCWKTKHNSNPACGDYKSEKMRLLPGTARERRDLGLAPSTIKTYLCDFCPVKSMVQTAYFDKHIKA